MTQDVIIIGAPRSGTNMLRDVLTSLPGFATWPCDEINLVWRHGNRREESDDFTASMARPEVCHYLHRQFARIGEKYKADTVVEKTCANSLRVDFVAQAFPKAKYVFIHRDGVDAAASAVRRWNAEFDLKYTLAKARYAPPSDLAFYAAKMARKRLEVRNDKGARAQNQQVTSWWGPRPHDFKRLQDEHTLEELAMIQWQRCVDSSLRGLQKLPDDQVLNVEYEQFVQAPTDGLDHILDFLDKRDAFSSEAVKGVNSRSIGQGQKSLGDKTAGHLRNLGGSTMKKLGYA
ncbi:sulfotransferase family protein [Arthrobacter castelli]|uniref:sulfotransferase family protein n=1 Tax=Arthrobacter castelli TaxID=271431 RepID=UPI000412420F|nr:sulfotransferase [Arthrobacter castelli]